MPIHRPPRKGEGAAKRAEKAFAAAQSCHHWVATCPIGTLGARKEKMGHHGDLQAAGHPLDPHQVARARAWLAVVLIPVAPDGALSRTALDRALARLCDHPACGVLPPGALAELATLTLRNIALSGPSAVLAAALPHLPRPEAETVLCHAARVARQRGHLTPQAATLLDVLARRLGVPPETQAAILDVTGMLDRP